MPDKVKIGIVGTGRMGTLHLTKFKNLPNVEFVGVYEPNPQRAKEISESMGVKTFPRIEELIFLSDGLVIASPTFTHFSIAKLAMESGCHVLVEKPLCESPEEALALDKLAHERGLVCQVGFLERYRLNAMMAGDSLASQTRLEFQRLSSVVGREPSVDVISDLMVHDIDLVLSIWRDEPTEIYAEGFSVVTDYIDFAKVELGFSGGKKASLTASRISPQVVRNLKAVSQNQLMEFNFVSNKKYSATRVSKEESSPEPVNFDALEVQAQSFITAIRGNLTPMITAAQGARVIEITDRIRKVILGQPIQVEKPTLSLSTPILREH